MTNYRELDPQRIIATLDQLRRRIEARFPGCGLGKLAAEVTDTARSAAAKAGAIAAPSVIYRLMEGALILIGLAILVEIALNLDVRRGPDSVYTVLQGVDSAFNIIVLMGASVLFVVRFEEIAKRTRALKNLHELRSIIHVIDMHQLTKDPSLIVQPGPMTEASPKDRLPPFELTRYLDYCSEMLSLTAKIAALYAQSSKDSVVIATVNDLEQLAGHLCEKIWQKISLLQRNAPTVAAPAPLPAPAPAPTQPAPRPAS